MKVSFFDVDGTLSAPQYEINGKMQIGTVDGWIAYCVAHGKDTYDACYPVQPVREYARKLQAQGVELYALSTSQTSFEHDAKQKFLDTHYPGLFQSLITVSQDEYKLEVIAAMAEQKQIPIEECELVEDTYATLLEAADRGIQSTHISMLMT